MTATRQHQPPPALVAGRYRLLAPLGAGGMGVVYRAVDERLGREVAVKLSESQDPGLAPRLRREADLLADVNHPHIVQIFDAGEHDGRPYIVTALIEGETLRTILARGPLAPAAVASLGGQVAGALAAAHRCAIVHRDLKPDNVMVSDGSYARLLDFGIAQRAGDTAFTEPGSVIGTAAYLSPEQLTGSGAVPGSDVYALGLVLLECLTGRPAFPGTVSEAVGARLVGPPPMPTSIGPRWRALLESMTAVDVHERPPADVVAQRIGDIDQPVAEDHAEPTTVLATAVAPVAVAPAAVATTGIATGAAVTSLQPVEPTRVMPPARPTPARTRPGRPALVAAALIVLLLVGALVASVSARQTSPDAPATGPATTVATPTSVPATTTAPPPAAAPTSVTTLPVTSPPPTNPPPGKGKPGKGQGKG